MANFSQSAPFFHLFFKEHVLNTLHQNKNVFNEHKKTGYNTGKKYLQYI